MKIPYKKFMSDPQKLSYMFNTVLVGCKILFLSLFFAGHMVWMERVEVFNFILTIVGYVVISKKMLRLWVFTLYFNIVEFMTLSSIAVGFGFGFQLYTISMITGAYYIKYVGSRFFGDSNIIKPTLVAVCATISYFIGYTFNRIHGPVYKTDSRVETFFFVFNSLLVIAVLVFYMSTFTRTIDDTENKLAKMALVDKLTGLYNRHYLLSRLDGLNKEELSDYWIAILDIDNFKKVNDVYGHNCGDYVLKNIAETARDECSNCTVCRWGGEEFIILASSGRCPDSILESLREKISGLRMNFEEQDIHVTVTIGTEKYSPDRNVDAWISEADRKLYFGKNNGKNQVVYVTNVQ